MPPVLLYRFAFACEMVDSTSLRLNSVPSVGSGVGIVMGHGFVGADQKYRGILKPNKINTPSSDVLTFFLFMLFTLHLHLHLLLPLPLPSSVLSSSPL